MSKQDDEAPAASIAEALAAQENLQAFFAGHRKPSADEQIDWLLQNPDLLRNQYPTVPEETP